MARSANIWLCKEYVWNEWTLCDILILCGCVLAWLRLRSAMLLILCSRLELLNKHLENVETQKPERCQHSLLGCGCCVFFCDLSATRGFVNKLIKFLTFISGTSDIFIILHSSYWSLLLIYTHFYFLIFKSEHLEWVYVLTSPSILIDYFLLLIY